MGQTSDSSMISALLVSFAGVGSEGEDERPGREIRRRLELDGDIAEVALKRLKLTSRELCSEVILLYRYHIGVVACLKRT